MEIINGHEAKLLEGVVKDPIILCPLCQHPARKKRYKPGYRCSATGCPQYDELVAGELQVKELKIYLAGESRQLLWEWAKSCQKREQGPRTVRGLLTTGSSCDPTSSVRVTGNEPVI